MGAAKRVATGAGLVGLAVLLTACSSGGSSSSATTTTVAAARKTSTGGTSATTVTDLAPACPSSGSPSSTDAIPGGGTHTHYTFATTDYASIVTACDSGLRAAGWTVTSTGGGGYGQYGGGGGTATKGSVYGTFDVGSSGSGSYLDVCVWPTRPADTNCGQNGSQSQSQSQSQNQSDDDNDNQNGSQGQNDNDNDNG